MDEQEIFSVMARIIPVGIILGVLYAIIVLAIKGRRKW